MVEIIDHTNRLEVKLALIIDGEVVILGQHLQIIAQFVQFDVLAVIDFSVVAEDRDAIPELVDEVCGRVVHQEDLTVVKIVENANILGQTLYA